MHVAAFMTALVAVGIMGFANQRGGTCTVAAFEEVVLEGRVKRLVALFEASLWAGAGFVLLDAAGLLAAVPVNYAAGAVAIAGGVLFGFGAVVNGNCIFGSLAQFGSGELSFLAMPFGFYFGGLAAAHLPTPTQSDERSPLIVASAWLVVPVLVLVLVRLYTHVRHMRQAGRTLSAHIWSPCVATTIIGIAFVVTTAAQQSWTYSEALSDLARRNFRPASESYARRRRVDRGGPWWRHGRTLQAWSDGPHHSCSSLRGRHAHGKRRTADSGRKYRIGAGRTAPSVPLRMARLREHLRHDLLRASPLHLDSQRIHLAECRA